MDHDYALCLLLMFPPSLATPHLKAIRPHTLSNYSIVMVSNEWVGRGLSIATPPTSRPYFICCLLVCLLVCLQALCRLSIDYSVITRQPGVKERSESILRSAGWGKRLGGHKVSYSEAFRGGMEERRKVASMLLRVREVPMETVLQYCW